MQLGSALIEPVIADHELLRVIGRGSYGEVWLARHSRLGTMRAVKIVRRDNFRDARPFQREFDGIRRYEPISRAHPNLVAILHVGGTDDCFYYVMELADDGEEMKKEEGRMKNYSSPPGDISGSSFNIHPSYFPKTLRSELKQHGSLSIDRCLEIAHALTSALAHLHANGRAHRDVKPSNIIFVGGVPKLADIGLVAGVDDARNFGKKLALAVAMLAIALVVANNELTTKSSIKVKASPAVPAGRFLCCLGFVIAQSRMFLKH